MWFSLWLVVVTAALRLLIYDNFMVYVHLLLWPNSIKRRTVSEIGGTDVIRICNLIASLILFTDPLFLQSPSMMPLVVETCQLPKLKMAYCMWRKCVQCLILPQGKHSRHAPEMRTHMVFVLLHRWRGRGIVSVDLTNSMYCSNRLIYSSFTPFLYLTTSCSCHPYDRSEEWRTPLTQTQEYLWCWRRRDDRAVNKKFKEGIKIPGQDISMLRPEACCMR